MASLGLLEEAVAACGGGKSLTGRSGAWDVAEDGVAVE